MAIKRLYQITDTHTRKPVPGEYFSQKPLAKLRREALNREHNETLRFVVSPGPDHRKHHS